MCPRKETIVFALKGFILTLLEPQSRFGDKPVNIQVVRPHNKTLKSLTLRVHELYLQQHRSNPRKTRAITMGKHSNQGPNMLSRKYRSVYVGFCLYDDRPDYY